MANYETLKSAITAVIKQNGNNEITGPLLQQSLLAMISSLGANFQFAGIATPTTNPGTPDQNVFYVAFGEGTFSNFGSTHLDAGVIGLFSFNGDWTYQKVYVGIVKAKATYNNTSAWVFDYQMVANKTYAIKALARPGLLAVGDQSYETTVLDEWVTITSTRTGQPFIYVGATPGTEPVWLFAEINTGVVDDSINQDAKISAANEKIAAVKETADAAYNNGIYKDTGSYTGSAYMFYNYQFSAGVKYYVKLLTSRFNGSVLAVADITLSPALKTDEWVEITPAKGGTPYIYTPERAEPPVLLFGKDGGAVTDSIKQDVNYTTINVSFDGTSKTGRTIHFSGLTAISDAINSVQSLANKNNRYIIHVEGTFLFTNPLDVPMLAGGEYSIIWMNPYIEIEGDGPENSCIMIDFPANATFHDGKNEADYQPVYFYGYGGKIRGMKIAGKNCRYTMHIEAAGASIDNQEIDVEDCELIGYGRPDYGGQTMTVLGTGLSSGLRWSFKNCKILDLYGQGAIGIHTPLSIPTRTPRIEFENCIISGQIGLGVYPVELPSFLSLKNCELSTKVGAPVLDMRYWNDHNNNGNSGDYSTFMVSADKLKALFRATHFEENRGSVLRVRSLNTGGAVRFIVTSGAFNVIIGNSNITAKTITSYGWDTQYGEVLRDGGANIVAQAFGTIDIDENSARGHSLGSRIGDRTNTSLTLGIFIDGQTFSVEFVGQDYTSKTNAEILQIINDVIGAYGIADVFCPGKLYYPAINGLQSIQCADANSIMRGMGIVFTETGMRRAKNSDGYIDGICLDDTANGQMGRIITRGFIDCFLQRSALSYHPIFTTVDDASSIVPGSTLGIGATDGEFAVGATPALLRFTPTCLQFI